MIVITAGTQRETRCVGGASSSFLGRCFSKLRRVMTQPIDDTEIDVVRPGRHPREDFRFVEFEGDIVIYDITNGKAWIQSSLATPTKQRR